MRRILKCHLNIQGIDTFDRLCEFYLNLPCEPIEIETKDLIEEQDYLKNYNNYFETETERDDFLPYDEPEDLSNDDDNVEDYFSIYERNERKYEHD